MWTEVLIAVAAAIAAALIGWPLVPLVLSLKIGRAHV